MTITVSEALTIAKNVSHPVYYVDLMVKQGLITASQAGWVLTQIGAPKVIEEMFEGVAHG